MSTTTLSSESASAGRVTVIDARPSSRWRNPAPRTVVRPSLTPVTMPDGSTAAIPASSEDHTKDESSRDVEAACSVSVTPASMTVEGITVITGRFTVTEAVLLRTACSAAHPDHRLPRMNTRHRAGVVYRGNRRVI